MQIDNEFSAKREIEEGEENFGFRRVNAQQKKNLVAEVFSEVASSYDLMNDFMSLGVHRLWKDEFCRMVPNLQSRIIDVAGGTGDIAFRLKEKARKQKRDLEIVVSDINPEMLKLCQQKAIDLNFLQNFSTIIADAEKLPFPDNHFDYYTIAFGIRNMVSPEKVLQEAHRILKPKGKFLCLEFAKIDHKLLKNIYKFYSFNIIPKIGKFVAKNQDAYQYLVESIELFPAQADFREMIRQAGFENAAYKNLSFGIASIYHGFKP